MNLFFFFCVGRGKCYYACPVTRITGLCGSRSDAVAIPTSASIKTLPLLSVVDPPQQVDFALKSPATTTLSCLLATLFVIADSVSMYLQYAGLFMLGEQYPLKQKTSPTRTPTIPSLLTSDVSSGSLPLRSVTHIEASPLVSLNQCGSCLFGWEIIIISG